MKNLTNTQLDILTNAFMKKVDSKKQAFKISPEYQEVLTEAKNEINYDVIVPLTERIDQIQEHIKALEEERKSLGKEVKDKSEYFTRGYYSLVTSKTLKVEINNIIDRKLNKRFPNKEDVQAEIVMMSIKKSDDILGNLEDKFFNE